MTLRRRPGPRDVGDLFSPFFRVAFRSLTKEPGIIREFQGDPTFETANLAGRIDGSDEAGDQIEFDSRNLALMAARLEIDARSGAAMKFTLTLTPPLEEAKHILENRLLGYATLVKVQWGYTSNIGDNHILSGVHVFLNTHPDAELTQDGATITLSGYDIAAAVFVRNTSKEQYDRRKLSDRDIVAKIIGKTNLTLDTTAIDGKAAFQRFFTPQNDPPAYEQHTTDFAFIRRILADHNLTFIADETRFKIFSINALSGFAEDYRLIWRLRPSGKRDLPIYNFMATNNKSLFMPPESRGLRVLRTDPVTGETIADDHDPTTLTDTEFLAPDGSVKTRSTADQPKTRGGTDEDTGDVFAGDPELEGAVIPRPRPGPNERGTVISTPQNIPNAEERGRQPTREGTILANTVASVTCPGMPDVFPPMIVRVEGVASIYDSLYAVLGVKHSIGTDGYTMDLELVRHGHTGMPGSRFRGRAVKGQSADSTTTPSEPADPFADDTGDATPQSPQ